jgi:predicted TIM-barrel fold metal-dependent hydrolase
MVRNGPIVKACKFFNLKTERLPRSIDDLLEDMQAAGVDESVILGQDTHATPNPSFKNYTLKHDDLAKLSRASKGKLIPFAGVDPNAKGQARRELKRVLKGLGFRGLKIHSSALSVFPNDKEKMYPLYDVCQEEQVPVLLHTGTTGLGDCEIRFSKPEYLDQVAQDFPDLDIVLAHFGWPWMDVALAVALRNPRVHLDVSGWRPKYIPSPLMPYLNGPLQDRFLFGTDYPMLRQTEWMADFKESLLPKLKPGVSEKLLKGNAKRLLRS